MPRVRGHFHELLNLAAVWKLPVLYVCENNQRQAFVHRRETMLTDGIATRAQSYGMEGRSVDGNDVEAVHAAASEAISRIRNTPLAEGIIAGTAAGAAATALRRRGGFDAAPSSVPMAGTPCQRYLPGAPSGMASVAKIALPW